VRRRDRGNKDVRATSDGARGLGAWVALSYDPFRIEVGEGEGQREKAGEQQGGSVLVDERMSDV
jgi:hypothetical protein